MAGNVTVAADSVDIQVGHYGNYWSSEYGGSGGSPFSDSMTRGWALVGLQVRSGSKIDQIRPIWRQTYGDRERVVSSTSAGGSGGSEGLLECNEGYYVAGISGRSGALVDALSLLCRKLDGTHSYKTGKYGGAGGWDFSFECPSQTFVAGIKGRSGSYLDQIQVYCN